MVTANNIRYVSEFFLRKMGGKKKKRENCVHNQNLRIQLCIPRYIIYTLIPELNIHTIHYSYCTTVELQHQYLRNKN